jgi:heme/copper-type cytochrome/quinol oxidase subunit 3
MQHSEDKFQFLIQAYNTIDNKINSLNKKQYRLIVFIVVLFLSPYTWGRIEEVKKVLSNDMVVIFSLNIILLGLFYLIVQIQNYLFFKKQAEQFEHKINEFYGDKVFVLYSQMAEKRILTRKMLSG